MADTIRYYCLSGRQRRSTLRTVRAEPIRPGDDAALSRACFVALTLCRLVRPQPGRRPRRRAGDLPALLHPAALWLPDREPTSLAVSCPPPLLALFLMIRRPPRGH